MNENKLNRLTMRISKDMKKRIRQNVVDTDRTITDIINDLVDDFAVCPECGCDLVLREEDGLIFVSCVDCSFCEC